MNFKDLYDLVEAAPKKPVTFELLRAAIIEHHPDIEEVLVYRLPYQPAIGQAHYTLFDDRTSAYDGEHLVADISYCASLESEPAELFFALCKELMHVFDPRDTWVDSREKFVAFLRDLQNEPLGNHNGALESERRARWMALIALCPKSLRDSIAVEIAEKRVLRSEIAQRLGLPVWAIEVALDDYYDTAIAILLE